MALPTSFGSNMIPLVLPPWSFGPLSIQGLLVSPPTPLFRADRCSLNAAWTSKTRSGIGFPVAGSKVSSHICSLNAFGGNPKAFLSALGSILVSLNGLFSK